MTPTLTAPAPTKTRAEYDRALARLEPLLDEAIALALELRSLSGEIFDRMSDEDMEQVMASRQVEDKIYAKLDLLKSATNCEIWI
jgi:hypothetical protein